MEAFELNGIKENWSNSSAALETSGVTKLMLESFRSQAETVSLYLNFPLYYSIKLFTLPRRFLYARCRKLCKERIRELLCKYKF